MSPLDLIAVANEIGVRAYCSKLAEQKWADVGTCGYADVYVPARSILGKAALEAGRAHRVGSLAILSVVLPPGIRGVQTMTVNVAAARAMECADCAYQEGEVS